jgi:hypothetical protein
LSKRVYEVDPLECPECGGEMKIINFIERRQTDVSERLSINSGDFYLFGRPFPKNFGF